MQHALLAVTLAATSLGLGPSLAQDAPLRLTYLTGTPANDRGLPLPGGVRSVEFATVDDQGNVSFSAVTRQPDGTRFPGLYEFANEQTRIIAESNQLAPGAPGFRFARTEPFGVPRRLADGTTLFSARLVADDDGQTRFAIYRDIPSTGLDLLVQDGDQAANLPTGHIDLQFFDLQILTAEDGSVVYSGQLQDGPPLIVPGETDPRPSNGTVLAVWRPDGSTNVLAGGFLNTTGIPGLVFARHYSGSLGSDLSGVILSTEGNVAFVADVIEPAPFPDTQRADIALFRTQGDQPIPAVTPDEFRHKLDINPRTIDASAQPISLEQDGSLYFSARGRRASDSSQFTEVIAVASPDGTIQQLFEDGQQLTTPAGTATFRLDATGLAPAVAAQAPSPSGGILVSAIDADLPDRFRQLLLRLTPQETEVVLEIDRPSNQRPPNAPAGFEWFVPLDDGRFLLSDGRFNASIFLFDRQSPPVPLIETPLVTDPDFRPCQGPRVGGRYDSPFILPASPDNQFAAVGTGQRGFPRLVNSRAELAIPLNSGFLDVAAVSLIELSPPCNNPADTNRDGQLTSADFDFWLNAYQQRLADQTLNNIIGLPAVTEQNFSAACLFSGADFNAFLQNFQRGCL